MDDLNKSYHVLAKYREIDAETCRTLVTLLHRICIGMLHCDKFGEYEKYKKGESKNRR